MRRVLKKLLEILDGTPAEYGIRQRGQSVLELALVSPLLVILIAGLAEIGWFANNYLILLEVTRVGARTATVQQNETSPLFWEDPQNGLLAGSVAPAITDPNLGALLLRYRNCNPTDIAAGVVRIGFYNFLTCVMLNSMNPLRTEGFDFTETGPKNDPDTGAPYPDDIVISAFAVQTIQPLIDIPDLALRNKVEWPLKDPSLVTYGNTPDPNAPQGVVVGRYPSNANECSSTHERDPFDYITDGGLTRYAVGSKWYDLELTVTDDVTGDVDLFGYDTTPETQVGFVWKGTHINTKTGCVGSDWTVKDIERLINLQGFGLKQIDPSVATNYQNQRRFVPSQGIVLVELHWKHETLSQFVGLSPVVSPVFAILGTSTTVSVWAIFPLPTTEPRIDFP
jgi:TadE-like protein